MASAKFLLVRWTQAIILAAWGAASVQAGEWRITPNLGLTEIFSDNINAAPSGLEESEFITSLSSGWSVNGRGSRVNLSANYNLQKSYFLGNSARNNLTHFLSSNVHTEVIRESFFVDAFASMSPTVTSNFGRITNRNFIDVGGNRANVLSYGLTPRALHHFGTWATATASTTFSKTDASDQNVGGNRFTGSQNALAGSGNNNSFNANLNSGRRFTRFNWGVTYNRRTFEANNSAANTNNQQSTLSSTIFSAGYRINRLVRINGSVGSESNDFIGNQNLNNGTTWSLGATFTPTRRTSLTGSFGKRSFGSTKNFSFSHRLRRVSITGSYSEDLSTTAEVLQRQQQQLFQNRDVFGNPLTTPFNPLDLTNPLLPNTNLSLTNDVFISRNFNSAIGYQYRLNTFSLGVLRSEQESGRTQAVEKVIGTNFSWSRPLGKRLSSSFNVDHQNRSGDAQQESTQALFITPSLSYALGLHVSTRLSYSYSENTSDLGTNDFQENSVIGTLSYAF